MTALSVRSLHTNQRLATAEAEAEAAAETINQSAASDASLHRSIKCSPVELDSNFAVTSLPSSITMRHREAERAGDVPWTHYPAQNE